MQRWSSLGRVSRVGGGCAVRVEGMAKRCGLVLMGGVQVEGMVSGCGLVLRMSGWWRLRICGRGGEG